jgi:hypothetical protein
MNIKQFNIKIPQAQIDDLHECIKKTIWPTVISGQNYGGPQIDNRQELARKALSLPFQDLFFANFADIVVNATDLGIHTADA